MRRFFLNKLDDFLIVVYIWCSKQVNLIPSHLHIMLQDTAELLMPQDLKKAQIYAGKKICFDNEEVTEIKTFGEPGGLKQGCYLQ